MSMALDWIAGHIAEGRTLAEVRAPERHREEIEGAGYAYAGEDTAFPERLVVVDEDGVAWAAVIGA